MERHKNATLAVDVMLINKILFMMTTSWNIHVVTAKLVKDMTLEHVVQAYHNTVFKVCTILGDGQLMEDMGTCMNICTTYFCWSIANSSVTICPLSLMISISFRSGTLVWMKALGTSLTLKPLLTCESMVHVSWTDSQATVGELESSFIVVFLFVTSSYHPGLDLTIWLLCSGWLLSEEQV